MVSRKKGGVKDTGEKLSFIECLLSAYMGDLYISPTYTVGLRLNILHILFNFQQSIMK